MNLFMRTIVLSLGMLLTLNAFAGQILLEKGDFLSAKESTVTGKILVLAKLSDSGMSKVKSEKGTSTEIEVRVAGVDRTLKQRDQIKGDGIQFGPFTHEEAQKIVTEINNK